MLGLIAVVGGIWALTLYSMNRYGTVTITGDTLREFGRDRLPLDKVDPEWVLMLAAKASPTLRERVGHASGHKLHHPGPRAHPARPRSRPPPRRRLRHQHGQ